MRLVGERRTRQLRRLGGVAVSATLTAALFAAQPADGLVDAAFYADLDLTRPELAAVKAEVDQGDFAAADEALRDFYAARETPIHLPQQGDVNAIPKATDLAEGRFEFAGMVRDYYDDTSSRIDVDWGDTWSDFENAPVDAPSLMHRFTFYDELIRAYLALPADDPRRDDLAVAWMQVAQDFIADMGDAPIGTAPHTLLTEGIRLRYWLDAFSVFRSSPAVSARDLVRYVDYIRHSADDIQRTIETRYGNNWYISLARSIYLAGMYLPEFKGAPTWRFKGMAAADRYVDRNMRSDGLSYEPALNYQNYAIDLMAEMQRMGQINGEAPFTDQELSYLILQTEALAAVTMPDFTVPLFGDTSDARLDFQGLATFADQFGRDDIRWVATRGASGQEPSWGSRLYPQSYAIMRSGWDTDDQYMFVGNQDSDYSASHRHPDDLGVVAYAYGRPLVVDPGVYGSAATADTWLRRTTEAHNTVEVGGLPQPPTSASNPLARRSLHWYSNDGFDFYEGEHEDYEPITHSRSVFSPKPGFWIVSDVLAGSPALEDYRQLWHFPADAPVSIDPATETVAAGFGDVPGVVVAPVDPGRTTTNLHPDGYVADGHGRLHSGVDYVSMSQTTPGDATFDTVLYPGDAGAAPDVSTSRIELPVPASVATAMRVNLPGGVSGVYYLSHEAGPAARTAGDYRYDGRLFYVETDSAGDVTRLSLAAGRTLVDGATTLVSSSAPVNDLSVEYSGSRLVLSTGEPFEADLTVHAPGVTEVVLNGSGVEFIRDGDAVTVAAPVLAPADTLLDEPFGSVRDGGVREWTFADGSAEHWQGQRGDWSVTHDATGDQVYRQTERRAVRGQTAVLASLDDASLSADVTRGAAGQGVHELGLLMRYQNPDNHYRLELHRLRDDLVRARITASIDGEVTILASDAMPIDLTERHQLAGTVRGDRIEFAVDGTVVAAATDARLTTGGVGLYAHRAEASFDNVRVDASTVWDFDDGSAGDWRGLSGTWIADQGAYHQIDTRQAEGMAIAEHDADDVEVAATVDLDQSGSSSYGYGVALRVHDARTYYMARIYRSSGTTSAELYKVIDGRRESFTSGPAVTVPLSLDATERHQLRVRASGDLLQFWIDGQLVATAIDSDLPTGGVGLQAHRASVSFDDVSVEELTYPKAWSASRGYFADTSESLRMESSGVTGSQLDLASTVLWEDYVAAATFLPENWSGAGEVGLTVRSTKDTLGYRCVLVDTGAGRVARIERFAGGSRATAAPVVIAEQPVDFSTSGPLPVEVIARGSKIEFWLDGSLLISATDTVIRRGGVSVIGSGVNAEVTGVHVRELVSQE